VNLSRVLHRCQTRLCENEADYIGCPGTAALSDKRHLPLPFETGNAVLVACLVNHNKDFRMTLEKSLRYSSTWTYQWLNRCSFASQVVVVVVNEDHSALEVPYYAEEI